MKPEVMSRNEDLFMKFSVQVEQAGVLNPMITTLDMKIGISREDLSRT